jgi:hypothetical protein
MHNNKYNNKNGGIYNEHNSNNNKNEYESSSPIQSRISTNVYNNENGKNMNINRDYNDYLKQEIDRKQRKK